MLDGGDGDYAEWAVAAYGIHDNLGLALEYGHGDEGPVSTSQWLLQAELGF